MVGLVIGAMAVGAAMDAYGKSQAGKAAKRAGREEQLAFERQAAETLQSAEEDVFIRRLKGASTMGAAKVAVGASGVDLEEDVLAPTAFFTEYDAQVVKGNARRAAWGLRERGRVAAAEGVAAARAGNYGAAASIIGGATRIGVAAYGLRGPGATADPSGSDSNQRDS